MDHRLVAGFIWGALFAAMVVGGLSAKWPADGSALVGETGIVASLAAVLGVIGAGAAGVGVYLNNRRAVEALAQTRKAEIATRFQKGAEMLGNAGTAIAGTALLQQAALEAPESYRGPVLNALTIFITETNEQNMEIVNRQLSPMGPGPGPTRTPRMHRSSIAALVALGRVFNADPEYSDPLGDMVDRRYPVAGLYVDGMHIHDARLSRLLVERTVIKSATFQDCDFTSTRFSARILRQTTFIDCDLKDAKFLMQVETSGGVTFRGCRNVETASLNGEPIEVVLERWAEQDARESAAAIRAAMGEPGEPD